MLSALSASWPGRQCCGDGEYGAGLVKQWRSSETVMLYKCNTRSSLHPQTQMFEKWIKLVKRETAFASRGFLWLMTMRCHIELNLQTSMGTEAMTLIFEFWRLIHSTNHIQCNVQFGRRANFVNSEKICLKVVSQWLDDWTCMYLMWSFRSPEN